MRTRNSIAATILCALCISLLAGCAQRNFAGTWNGSVSFKMPPTGQAMTLPLTFHVTKKDDGTYSSTLDITTFKMTGLPVKSFVVDGDKVTVGIQVPTGSYDFTGTTNANATEITGSIGQGKDTSPMTLTKAPDAK
jgi:hypothetical protein